MSTGLDRTAGWVAQAVGGALVPGGAVTADTVLAGPAVTDSRQAVAGSLFVAVDGEHADGHDYATSTAGPTGSVLVLASRPVEAPHVLVQDMSRPSVRWPAPTWQTCASVPPDVVSP